MVSVSRIMIVERKGSWLFIAAILLAERELCAAVGRQRLHREISFSCATVPSPFREWRL